MSIYVNCVNCGKQNYIEDDDPWNVKCEYGNHKVRIKREDKNMSEIMTEKNVSESTIPPADLKSTLPPVPPRPDVTGKTLREKLQASHDYYEANKAAILHDLDTLGEKEMLKRWKITQGTWGTTNVSGLRNRWRPERYGAYISSGVRKNLAKAAATPALEKPVKLNRHYIKKEKEKIEIPKAEKGLDQKARTEGNFSKPESTAVDKSNQPINLPEFKDSWQNEVQIAWLKTFIELKTLQMIAGVIDNKNERRRTGWFQRLFPRR